MRAGLFLAYWPWFSPEEQVELAVLADELGLDSVWVSEAWGQDAVSVLGLLAGKTERVALGSGLMQIPARQPAATAMAAATLDVLSGGRFRLGLGVSGPQVVRGLVRRARSRARSRRTREYVEIVRTRARPRGPLEHDGRGVRRCRCRTGSASRSSCWPGRSRSGSRSTSAPIGPKAVEQVGEIADGWLPFMLDPGEPDVLLEPLRPRAREGRAARCEDIDIAPVVPVPSHEDLDAARDAVAAVAGLLPRRDGRARRRTSTSSSPSATGHGDGGARGARSRCSAATAWAPRRRSRDELIDAMAHRHHARGPRRPAGRLRGAPASTTLVAVPCGRPRRRSCGARRRRSRRARCLSAGRAPASGIPGSELRRARSRSAHYAARAARRLRELRARAGLRRGVRLQAGRAQGVVRAARRARRAAVLDVARGLRRARAGAGRSPTARRSSSPGGCDYYPGLAHLLAVVLLRGRATCASPARATCSPSSTRLRRRAARRGPVRAAEARCRARRCRAASASSPARAARRATTCSPGLRRRGWAGRLVWAFAPVQDRHAAPRDHARAAGPRGAARRSR